jgi:cell division septum initiation protein DivIVA
MSQQHLNALVNLTKENTDLRLQIADLQTQLKGMQMTWDSAQTLLEKMSKEAEKTKLELDHWKVEYQYASKGHMTALELIGKQKHHVEVMMDNFFKHENR